MIAVPLVKDPLSVSEELVPLDTVLSRAVAQEGGLVDDGPWDDLIQKAAETLRQLRTGGK